MSKKILLADDSITIQKVIALTFAGEDYKITTVDNGADAIARAREIKPDIILADAVMPQKNGYEVCEFIKNDPELKTTPVLLLAGTFEPFDEDLANKVGADGYIIKPFESQALIQKVKESIGARPAMPAAPAAPAAPRPAAPVPPRPVTPTAMPTPAAPPVVTPAAPVPPKPPVAPVVTPAPVSAKPQPAPAVSPPAAVSPTPSMAAPAPPAEEDFWGILAEEVEEKGAPEEKTAAAAPPEEEIWEIGEVEAEEPKETEGGEEDFWESFSFEETEEKGIEEPSEKIEEEEPTFGAEEIAFGEEAVPPHEAAEEEITFAEETPVEKGEPGFLEEVSEEPLEVITEEEAVGEEFAFEAEAPKVAEIRPQPEILQGFEQTFEPEALGMEAPVEAPSEKPIEPLPPSVSLSEDQLRAALSQVSREVIEKVVWEVVPDLAEMLIKEEIKRLQKK